VTTPESKIKARVRKLLTHPRIWQFWPVPSGMQAATLDIHGVIRVFDLPVFFMVETKAPDGRLTLRQRAHVQAMRDKLNVRVFVVRDDRTFAELEAWIKWMLSFPERATLLPDHSPFPLPLSATLTPLT